MALDALVLSKGKMMQDNVSSTILKESSVLITDVDLHLSHSRNQSFSRSP